MPCHRLECVKGDALHLPFLRCHGGTVNLPGVIGPFSAFHLPTATICHRKKRKDSHRQHT